MSAPLYACIEAGGTKFLAGLVRSPHDIVETARFDTTDPEATLGGMLDWFAHATKSHGPLTAAGIASFGPVELDRSAANWGHITGTTKKGWSHTDFAGRVGRTLGVPVGFDTDVNGAALAETRWGAGQGQKIAVYLTVGTGIGGGVIVNGVPLHGLSHPEMGHIRPQRHPEDTSFAGICPFHGDCMEGLASGPAIIARWGASLSALGEDHPARSIIAWYLAQMVVTLQSIMEPGRIIIGGGVTGAPGLLDMVRASAKELGSAYFRGDPADIIVAPGLGDKAGLLGGLALALDEAARAHQP